jgi:hypothetical protein
MQIAIEATEMVTKFDGVECRLWKGTTADGVECLVFVHRIAVHKDHDSSAFDRELEEKMPPGAFVPLTQIIGGGVSAFT